MQGDRPKQSFGYHLSDPQEAHTVSDPGFLRTVNLSHTPPLLSLNK